MYLVAAATFERRAEESIGEPARAWSRLEDLSSEEQ